MKKKWMSRALALGLSLTMAMGLCSCGNRNNEQSEENNRLAKENVYKMEEMELPLEGDEYNIQSTIYLNDRLYMIANVYHWSEGGETETVLLSMNMDGSDMQKLSMEMPEPYKHEEVGTEEGENNEDTEDTEDTGNSGSEGEAVPLPMPREETLELDAAIAVPETSVAVEVTPGEEEWVDPGYYESTYYGSYTFSEAGKLYGIENYNYENYGDPNNYVYESKAALVCWDLEGKLQWKTPIIDNSNGENNLWVNYLLPMADGSVYIIYSGNGDGRIKQLVDANGVTGEQSPMNMDSTKMNNMQEMIAGKDGKFMVIYYDEEWVNMYIATYDLVTDTMSEGQKLPDTMSMNGYYRILSGLNTDLVYSNSNGVYTLNIGDAEPTKLMDYVNSDVVVGYMNNIIMLDDTHFIAIFNGSDWSKMTTAMFTKVNPEDVQDKKVLTLGGTYVSSDIRQAIVDFNKTNSEYKIIVKDYSQYTTREDYENGTNTAVTRLNNDIISGNMPDILCTSTELNINAYISKGLLADIGELLDKDDELNKEDYLPNVIEAFSVDGKLYHVVPRFYVSTFLTHQDIVGERDSMTLSELQQIISEREGSEAFQYITQSNFMYRMMNYFGTDFVDPATGTCNFNSPEFISMLEYAKTLPEEYVYDEESEMDYYTQYSSGRVIMGDYTFSDFNVSYYVNGMFNGKVNYTGFPGADGSSSVLSAYDSYVISAKSANIDGAWSFLRQYLTKEYQENMEYGLPIMTSVFDEKSKNAMERPFWIDENGEKVEYDNTMWNGTEEVIIPPLNQEQYDELVAFIKSVNRVGYYNSDIQNLVIEDVAPFFSGQKSAEEVAGIIQSRVQLFVDENS